MKHFDVEIIVPVVHAETWEEALDKFLAYMEQRNLREFVYLVRDYEDQRECPGNVEECDATWDGKILEM